MDLITPYRRNGLNESIYKDAGESQIFTGVKKDGGTFHLEMIEQPYSNFGKIISVAIVKNITERIENERRIEFMAFYEELTDLPNCNFFVKILKEAIVSAKETSEMLAVYFIDLNYFKEINDTLGYSFGDKLLQACAGKNLNHFCKRIHLLPV